MTENAPRILIIDDDENIRKTLEILLNNEGYLVDFAANGKEAIEKTNSTIYNVLIVDMKLPDMEGTDLLVKIKDTVPKMRKIILTGFPSQQNAIDSINKRADVYLLKPVDVDKILATIREQLKLQNEEKQYCEQKVLEYIESKTREASGESSTIEDDTHEESLSTLRNAKNFICANTGFPALDEVIGGGIPKPCCVCVSGESLSYMNTFVFQMVHNFLENGLKGLYICVDHPASEIKQYFDEIGLNIDRYSEDYSIFFLDFFSQSQDALIESGKVTSLAYSPDESLKAIGQFLDWIKEGFIVIDTVSTFTLNLDSKKTYEFIRAMKLLARTFNLIIIGIMYTAPMDPKTLNLLHSVSEGNFIFDNENLRVASFRGLSQNEETLIVSKKADGKLSLRQLLPDGVNNKMLATIKAFSKSSTLKIIPRIESMVFPEIDIPINEVHQNLEKLSKAEILKAEPYCSGVSCPQCSSKEAQLYLKCPACKSVLLQKGETLEHFNCGHIDFRPKFERNGKLVCPKCTKELRQIGVDYKQVGFWYKCTEGHTFPNIHLKLICTKCSHEFDLDNAKIEILHRYELTEKGKKVSRENKN